CLKIRICELSVNTVILSLVVFSAFRVIPERDLSTVVSNTVPRWSTRILSGIRQTSGMGIGGIFTMSTAAVCWFKAICARFGIYLKGTDGIATPCGSVATVTNFTSMESKRVTIQKRTQRFHLAA